MCREGRVRLGRRSNFQLWQKCTAVQGSASTVRENGATGGSTETDSLHQPPSSILPSDTSPTHRLAAGRQRPHTGTTTVAETLVHTGGEEGRREGGQISEDEEDEG